MSFSFRVPECRICREPELDEDPLVTPCLCRGSVGHVHKSCIVRWRTTGYSVLRRCEMCAKTFGPAAAVPQPEKDDACLREGPERSGSPLVAALLAVGLFAGCAFAGLRFFHGALSFVLAAPPPKGMATALVLFVAHAAGSVVLAKQVKSMMRSSGGSVASAGEPLSSRLRTTAAHFLGHPRDLAVATAYVSIAPYMYALVGIAYPAADALVRRAQMAWWELRHPKFF
ncbi:hypothetical protein DFJ74DRAFT_287906 [Hyaloraphidium curvatum]|nr:hypothetical protein DFJ74DRAFT_287906 [Hyaloraphidium curvatum]